jgi:hypothetical protein
MYGIHFLTVNHEFERPDTKRFPSVQQSEANAFAVHLDGGDFFKDIHCDFPQTDIEPGMNFRHVGSAQSQPAFLASSDAQSSERQRAETMVRLPLEHFQ